MKLITQKLCWILLFYCSFLSAQKHTDEINKINRTTIPILNTGCTNMDFKEGTAGWTYHWSNSSYGTKPSQDADASSQYGNASRFIIDPVTNETRFEVLPANSFDIRLGQVIKPNAAVGEKVLLMGRREEVPSGGGNHGEPASIGQEEVSKKFTVTAQKSALQYGYAIVFEQPDHENPNSFSISLDVNNATVTGCSETSFTVDMATLNNGFMDSAVNPIDKVRSWAINTIDLLSIPGVRIGSEVTITFRNRDCSLGSHGSYAYISARCLPPTEVISATNSAGICTGQYITFDANVDVFPGATTKWEILSGTTVIHRSYNRTRIFYRFAQDGTYTVRFTMDSPMGGCSLTNSTIFKMTKCCKDCKSSNEDIFNSIKETNTCGKYQITVPEEIPNCYKIILNREPELPIEVTADMLNNGVFTFDFPVNGVYDISIELIDLKTGKVCYSKKKKITVSCCESCNTLGTTIFNSLEYSRVCGAYYVKIPEVTFECYNVEITTGLDTTLITEVPYPNGMFVFDFDQNGWHAFSIKLYDKQTGTLCYSKDDGVIVYCLPPPVCKWPKTIGTYNPNDPENYASEYVSDLAEDSNGNIVVLGRSRIYANIEGVPVTDESYLAKYTPEGCLDELITMPNLRYPVQMELQDDNSMIILSRQTNPFGAVARNFYLEKYTDTGLLIWSVRINLELHINYEVIKFVLRPQNGDIFLNLTNLRGDAPNTVYDSSGSIKKFNQSAVLRFTKTGRLTWSEEFNVLSGPFGTLVTDPRTIDIDFDEATNELWVLLYGNDRTKYELVNQGINLKFAGTTNHLSKLRSAAIGFRVNDALNTISYTSSFNLEMGGSPTHRIAVQANNVYVAARRFLNPFQRNYINIYNRQGTLLEEKFIPHRVDEMESMENTTDILVHGDTNNSNGYGITKLAGLNQVWSHHQQTHLNNVNTRDLLEHSDGKIYLAGNFNREVGPFAPLVGGYDGFITRFSNINGTITTGFFATRSLDVNQVKLSNSKISEVAATPNPFVDQFVVSNNSDSAVKYIEVYNMRGTMLRKQAVTNSESVMMSEVPSGIYFVKVYFENGSRDTIKVVKK